MKVMIGYPPLESPWGQPTLGQNRQFRWFGNPSYVYPMVMLIQRGLVQNRDPKTFFKDFVYSGSHDAGLMALVNGHVDALASFDQAREQYLKDPAEREKIIFVAETAPIYDSICHPAFWIAQANEFLMRNIALGPWIHTASDARHYALARDGDWVLRALRTRRGADWRCVPPVARRYRRLGRRIHHVRTSFIRT